MQNILTLIFLFHVLKFIPVMSPLLWENRQKTNELNTSGWCFLRSTYILTQTQCIVSCPFAIITSQIFVEKEVYCAVPEDNNTNLSLLIKVISAAFCCTSCHATFV